MKIFINTETHACSIHPGNVGGPKAKLKKTCISRAAFKRLTGGDLDIYYTRIQDILERAPKYYN